MSERVALLAGGDSVYVFHEGDDRIDIQRTVMIGANLDVDGPHLIGATRWVFDVRPALEKEEVTIIDCRESTVTAEGR